MIPRILHQFWDRPVPPEDVAERMRMLQRQHPEWEYICWNDVSAASMIGSQFGTAAERCFRACTIPAMRSDILRIAAALRYGGAYADADMNCVRPLDPIASARCALYHRNRPEAPWMLYNAFIMAEPGHPLMELAWKELLMNVEKAESKNVSLLTGPRMLTHVWQTRLTEEQRASVRLLTKKEMFSYLNVARRLSYQREEGSWKRQMRSRRKVIDFALADATDEQRRPADAEVLATTPSGT